MATNQEILPEQPQSYRSYILIGLLIVAWVAITWLTVKGYYGRLADNVYQRESQLGTQQAEEVADNIDENIELLKGIAQMVARDKDTLQALRRFGADAAPSALDYEVRKQRWTQDKEFGELNNSFRITASSLKTDNVLILNAVGDCIASYNAGQPDSFVGTNYADREYFRQTRAGASGHQYAVGRKNNIPGLYYSYPVLETGHFLGAAVVKRDITKFARWTDPKNAFISDANGVIILASDKHLEDRTLPDASVAKLSAEKQLLQYKQNNLEPLEIIPWGNARFPAAVLFGGKKMPIVLASRIMPEDAITIYVPRPLDELVRLGSEMYFLFFLLATGGSVLIVAVSSVIYYVRGMRQRTEQLRVSHEHSNRLLNSMFEGVYGVDTQGNCTFVNETFLKMLAYPNKNEVLGKNMHELIHHSHADGSPYPANECKMYQAYRRNQSVNISDEVFWRKYGVAIPVEYWSHPVVTDGAVIGAIVTFIDITERKKAEESLRDMAARFHTVFELSADAILLLDEKGFFDCNTATLRMFGCPTRDAFISKHPAEFSPPTQPGGKDSLSLANEHIVTAVKNGSNLFEWMHRRLDGTDFPAEVLLTALELNGKPVLQGTVRDITERKRAEQALRTSEAEFRTLAEAMPQIVWITRADGWSIYFNQQWMDYTGFTLEESLGYGWNKPIHPDDQRRAWDTWQHATATKFVYSIESRLRRADGVYRWWLVRGVPQQDAAGTILKWFGTCTDIHDMKMAELEISRTNQALHESDVRYRGIFEYAYDIIYLLEPDGTFRSLNNAFERITGWTAAEWIGKPFAPIIHPDDLSYANDIFMKTLAGESLSSFRLRIAKKSGEYFDADLSITPLGSNEVTGVVGIARDITERKQAENKLAEQYEELRRWHEVTSGREERILNLKHEVNELLSKTGKHPRYPSAESQIK